MTDTISGSAYALSHSNRANLLIHILAVPLFWLASIALLTALLTASWKVLTTALLSLAVSMALQATGHKLERTLPPPFSGPGDFVRRIFAEQFYRFPAFVLSGRFWRTLHSKAESS